MNINDIKKILPHRYPFLFVDRVLSIEEKKIIAVKSVTGNEDFFNGHFPGYPLMPGVIIIEAMAQVGGVLLLSKPEYKDRLAVFAGIDGVRFRRQVVPGDQLVMTAEILQIKGPIVKFKTSAKVNDELVTEAELMFSFVSKPEGME